MGLIHFFSHRAALAFEEPSAWPGEIGLTISLDSI